MTADSYFRTHATGTYGSNTIRAEPIFNGDYLPIVNVRPIRNKISPNASIVESNMNNIPRNRNVMPLISKKIRIKSNKSRR